MSSASYFISPNDLWKLIGTAQAPQIVDVCRREVLRRGAGRHADRAWRDADTGDWIVPIDRTRPIVVACKAAHDMSQMVGGGAARRAAYDRAGAGRRHAAWSEAGLPLVDKATLDRFAPKRRACG